MPHSNRSLSLLLAIEGGNFYLMNFGKVNLSRNNAKAELLLDLSHLTLNLNKASAPVTLLKLIPGATSGDLLELCFKKMKGCGTALRKRNLLRTLFRNTILGGRLQPVPG